MSAYNTRGIKSSDMFVRTHFAFYFVSLLLGDVLQGGVFCLYMLPWYMRPGGGAWVMTYYGTGVSPLRLSRLCLSRMPLLTSPRLFAAIGSIINVAWVQEKAVFFGSFCVAQGAGACRIVHDTLAEPLSTDRCHQAHLECRHCHLVSPIRCVDCKAPHFNRFLSGLWYDLP